MKPVYIAFLLQACAGLALLLLAVAVLVRKGTDRRLRSFLIMTGCAAAWVLLDALRLFSAFAGGPTAALSSTAGMFVVFTGWTVFSFALRYPDTRLEKRARYLEILLLVVACLVALLPWRGDWVFDRRIEHGIPVASNGWPFLVTSGHTLLLTSIGLVLIWRKRRHAATPTLRAQLLYVFAGILAFTFFAYLFSLLLPLFGLRHLFFLGPTSALFFFGAVFYAIVRRRLFDARGFLPYFVAAAVSLLGAGAIAYGVSVALLTARMPHPLELALLVCALLVLGAASYWALFWFLRSGPLRSEYRIDDLLNHMTEAAAVFATSGFDAMCIRLAAVFCRVVRLKRAVVCVPGPDGFRFLAVRAMPPAFPQALARFHRIFSQVTPLVQDPRWPSYYWVEDSAPTDAYLDSRGGKRIKELTHRFRDELLRQEIDVYIPIRYAGVHLAFFFLGRKENERPWYRRELDQIGAVTGLIAVALRNNQIFSDLYRLKESLRIRNEALIDSSTELTRRMVSLDGDRSLIYVDSRMERCVSELERVGPTSENVLIQGESGTGKELAARLVHERSPRAGGAFVAVNCGAFTESILESQLFGHEAGAFTGANRRHRGIFEQAQGGTVFLDEVGEMPPSVQVRLLRALQERTIVPLGSERPLKIDVRLVAATNRNLEELVGQGAFREDLYYRLNVATIRVPPLRERPADIPLLIQHYLKTFAERLGRGEAALSEDAQAILCAHDWPGNVRELENVLIRALLQSTDGRLLAQHFAELLGRGLVRTAPPEVTAASPGESTDSPVSANAEGDLWRRSEEAAIMHALKLSGGNRTRAARILGMSRSTLYERMKKHALQG